MVMKSIDNICEINPSKKDVMLTNDSTEVSFLSMSNVSAQGIIDLSETRLLHEVKNGFTYFKNGDVLFAKITPCMENGKGALVDNLINATGFGSTEFHVLRPKTGIDGKWLYYITKSKNFRKAAEVNMTGSAGQKRVPVSFFNKYKVFVPLLEQQRKISHVLDKAQELIDKRKEQIAACDELIKSLFYHMFGDPIVNPKKWDIYILRDIAESRLGKMLDVKKQTGKYKYPYLANYNVQWFCFELSSLNQMDFDEKDRNEFDLKCGDVLVTEGGEVGRCAIWKEQIDKCYFQKALHRIRCDTFLILPEYLVRVFYFRSQHNQFEDVVGSKSTIAHLTGEKLKILKIPVPPLDLQNDFAKKVEKIEQQKQLLAQSLTELENNFNSLMQHAFKGELF